MTCKIDHTIPGTIPAALCRGCHPELNMTPERRRALDDAERARQREIDGVQRAKWELAKASRDIESRTRHGEPEPGSVAAKIIESLRRKAARLTQELQAQGVM